MTLQQLEYLIAVDTHRHFLTAAKETDVTQPTLSMQIRKLEKELGIIVFDRSKQPVVPTSEGKALLKQARAVLHEVRRFHELAKEQKGEMSGHLLMGVIPTVAPYLIPLFLKKFHEGYPNIKLSIREMTTEEIVTALKKDLLDCAVLATPLNEPQLTEKPLYYEPFVCYLSEENPLLSVREPEVSALNLNELVLLGEAHCLRGQIETLCSVQDTKTHPYNLDYQAGSLDTLRKIVDLSGGMTLMPELATFELEEDAYERVRYFKSPQPVREISIVTHRRFIKERHIEALQQVIREVVPSKMLTPEKRNIISIKRLGF